MNKTDWVFVLIFGPLVLSLVIFTFVVIANFNYIQETKRIAAENCVFVERTTK